MKRIVILGGMGPQASVELHGRLVAAAGTVTAGTNDAYPHIVHLSVPVPDFIDDTAQADTALALLTAALRRSRVWQG